MLSCNKLKLMCDIMFLPKSCAKNFSGWFGIALRIRLPNGMV